MIWRLRLALGRWLLRPVTRRVVRHYADAAKQNRAKGKEREAERCDYMVIGASYVGFGRHYDR